MEQTYSRILSINEEPALRERVVAHLEDNGFTVFEAENGEQGLELFYKEKPDLVLSDLHMPKIDGLDVLSKIQHDSPETPFIVVSSKDAVGEAVDALRLGAWDFLLEPFTDMTIVEHTVCKALERARLVSENKLYREKLEKANEQLTANLRTLEEDQKAGKNVQMQLLPENRYNFEQYSFEYTIIPSLYLSGDFIDYFLISENRFGFYIADVSGHGASSAFVTVLLKSIMSQLQSRYQAGVDEVLVHPDKVLKMISEEILEAKLGKYLTMVYCVLDYEKNTLTYSVGGHYPSPILFDGNKAEFLKGEGFAVGIFSESTFKNQEIVLPEKFSLALFSDGILEVMPGKDLTENEGLLLQKLSGLNLTPEKVFKKMNIDASDSMPDDISLLILARG